MLHKLDDISDFGDIEKFLCGNEDNNVFQSVFYFKLNLKSSVSKPYYIVFEENGALKGIMLVNIQNFFGKMLKDFASRSVIIGGPVADKFNPESVSKILAYYKSTLPKEVIYTQVRNMMNMSYCRDVMLNCGYSYAEHLNYLIDLSESMEKIWSKVYTKRRNEIRRASKEGVSVREINYEVEFDESYKILCMVYAKAKLPVPDKGYFANAKKLSDETFKIFGAFYEGKLIGIMYALCYNRRVYNWYAGSIPDYLKKYPNDIITWEVIKWAKINGYSVFDFGGAGNPKKEYGVRDFKKKFGGNEVNYGRYELIHKPGRMKISEMGFRTWQKIRGKD
ncbi:MAG: GNAT family N-acetyltransferase [Ignavibacteria bacterium]|jgi:lipid II:glycine glycyltransferase (peptidoglycan interpeptide bridge formation enzyme)|nr:GNAT family N-acetyltransferase [Ignavibacteria bacterium]